MIPAPPPRAPSRRGLNGWIGVRVAAVLAVAVGVASCGGTDTTAVDTGSRDAAGRTTFRDPVGDVAGGAGPDVVSVTVAHTPADVTFGIRFAEAPPLRASRSGGWVDMLLVGIDVPPSGPPPTPTGWNGVDYVAGLHGPEELVLFRSVRASSGDGRPGTTTGGGDVARMRLERLRATADGATLRFSIPRRMLGDPASFGFSVAAGREGGRTGGGSDFAPSRGAFDYRITP